MDDPADHIKCGDAIDSAMTEAVKRGWIEPERDERGEIVYRRGEVVYKVVRVPEQQEVDEWLSPGA